MIAAIKRTFGKLSPLEVASRELASAELEKLAAQTAQEYAASIVAYNTARIDRLRKFIAKQASENKEIAA